MKRLFNYSILSILLFLIYNNLTAQTASVCCPYLGWDYIVPITITNNSGVATTANLQTLLVLNTQTPIAQGKMQANGNDIRFVYNTCGNFLDYYIENGINTTQTNIWVKMPAIAAGASITIYLYYGNATASQGAVTLNNMFPNILTLNAPTTLSGTQTYDWIDVQAGAAITMTAQQPLILQARKIIFNGSFNGLGLGYAGQTGPGAGASGNGSIGGAGGGYGGAGGRGGNGNNGGVAYGTPIGLDIDMGSGGGGSDCPATGIGGGALSLRASSLVFNGTVNVNGRDANNCTGNPSDEEAAGAGAGGGVLALADYISGNATITANGGKGGNSSTKEGGGGGGGGRIKILYTTTNTFAGTGSVLAGAAGTGTQSGMQAGSAGTFTQTQIQGLAITQAAEVPVSLPLANFNFNNVCLNTLASFTDASTVAPSGSISQWSWNFGDGVGASNQQNPTYTYTAANTYTVTLTVTSVSGCTNTTTAQIAVSVNPTADFAAQNVCEGFPSPFTDASSNNVTQWNWAFGDGNTSINQNPIHSYAAAGNYNVTLTVTTFANCTATVQKQVTVNQSPVANFNFTNACFANANTFADASSSAVGNINNWQWDFGDGTGSSTQQNPNYTFSVAGSYDVTLTVGAGGCSNIITKTVTVYGLPVAQGNATAVCLGNTTDFTDGSTISSGNITQWNWSFGDGSSDVNSNTTHTFLSSGNYNATLTVTSDNGCIDTETIPVTVYAKPVPDFNVASVCLGLPAQFNDASSVNSGSISNWVWYFGDGNTAAAQNASNTYNTTGNYNIKLLVQTDNGCIDSVQKQVSVFENPEFSYSAIAACFDESNGSATATPSNGATPYSYNWQNGQTSATASNLSAGNYNITVIDANGCTVSGTAIVTQPLAPLVISATPDTFTIGFGDTVQFNLSNNYYPEIQYVITPDYNLNCNSCDSVLAYPNQTTTYLISATDSNGCSAQKEVTVTVTEKYVLYIPNVFTPNGNGTNDNVKVFARGVKTFYWVIFNRWGEKVFESNDINIAWDGTYKGKLLNPDVYVYKVQLSYLTGKMVEQKGSISILK